MWHTPVIGSGNGVSIYVLDQKERLMQQTRKSHHPMGTIKIAGVVAGGLLAGAIWQIVSFAWVTFVLAEELEAILRRFNASALPPQSFLVHLTTALAGGVLLVWLYAAMRSRFGWGLRSALIAGFVVWLFSFVTFMATAVVMNMFSRRLAFLAGLGGMIATSLAAFVGTSAYKDNEVVRQSSGGIRKLVTRWKTVLASGMTTLGSASVFANRKIILGSARVLAGGKINLRSVSALANRKIELGSVSVLANGKITLASVFAFVVAVAALALVSLYSNVQGAILVVLFLTLCAVVWYSRETHLLRLQSFRPYVLLIRKGDKKYCYVNAGNGAALNVHVVGAWTTKGKVNATWKPVTYLERGTKENAYLASTLGMDGYDPLIDGIPDDQTENGFEAAVVFDDIEGTSYETRVAFKRQDRKVGSRVKWSRRSEPTPMFSPHVSTAASIPIGLKRTREARGAR